MANVVVDTNVLFQGITGHGAAYRLIRLWQNGDRYLRFCLCNAVVAEYETVLRRMLSPARWLKVAPALAVLVQQAWQVDPQFRWGPAPAGPARKDELFVNCAMNASAAVVTYNRKGFRWAIDELRLQVFTPAEVLHWHQMKEANR